MLNRNEIRIRDPYILTDRENGCYWMYGTTALAPKSLAAYNTFSVYKSYDLETFEEPRVIFDGGAVGFWADRDYWAPEVHVYGGKYYLFGSVKANGRYRTTEIFVSDTPDGVFTPLLDKPVTPEGWHCLDGTLLIEGGVPYLVFCHEWMQVGDGEICAIELSEDLCHSVGEAKLLFHASDEPLVTPYRDGKYVTDGPFFYREGGMLRMIWSSYSDGRYLVLEAEADSLFGEWKHLGCRYDFDGGHAMLFETLDGKRMISLHSPNSAGDERAVFLEY